MDDLKRDDIERLREQLVEAFEPVFRQVDPGADEFGQPDEQHAARLALWAMLTLAVDVAMFLGMSLEETEEVVEQLREYAGAAHPIRVAERLTRHQQRGLA